MNKIWWKFHIKYGGTVRNPLRIWWYDGKSIEIWWFHKEITEKVYFRSQIPECASIGEYWNISGVPVLPKNGIFTFFRSCWRYPEANNTGTPKWFSIVQYSCTSTWDLKFTFSKITHDKLTKHTLPSHTHQPFGETNEDEETTSKPQSKVTRVNNTLTRFYHSSNQVLSLT